MLSDGVAAPSLGDCKDWHLKREAKADFHDGAKRRGSPFVLFNKVGDNEVRRAAVIEVAAQDGLACGQRRLERIGASGKGAFML